jgi:hypothetical protein
MKIKRKTLFNEVRSGKLGLNYSVAWKREKRWTLRNSENRTCERDTCAGSCFREELSTKIGIYDNSRSFCFKNEQQYSINY